MVFFKVLEEIESLYFIDLLRFSIVFCEMWIFFRIFNFKILNFVSLLGCVLKGFILVWGFWYYILIFLYIIIWEWNFMGVKVLLMVESIGVLGVLLKC